MSATVKSHPSSSSPTSSDSRTRSPHRQNGFSLTGDHEVNPNQQYLSRTRNTTSSTVTLREHTMAVPSKHEPRSGSDTDSDIEMDEGEKPSSSSLQPLPIPRSQEARATDQRNTIPASQTPSDISTPPDAMLASHSTIVGLRTPSSKGVGVKLPSIQSISPGFSGSQGTHTTQWSPGRSSDPHLYSISGSHGSYPFSSIKPYLSTSFRTSAERSGSSQIDDPAEDDEHEEDVFGHTASGLGLQESPHYQPRQSIRSSVGGDGEGEGDSAGVFSFSSPYLRPRSIDDQVPGLPPSPPDNGVAGSSQGGAPPDRVLSPSWTARSLQQLSLGGGVEMTASSSSGSMGGGIGAKRNDRSSRPSHLHHPHSYTHAHSAFSRSLPSGPINMQQGRRLSSGRLTRPVMPPASGSAYSISPGAAATFGNATLYSRSPSSNSPYARSPGAAVGFGASMRPAPYHTSTASRVPTTFAMDVPGRHSAERSRSRQRWVMPRGTPAQVYDEDDDETDDEMMLPGQVEIEDDEHASQARSPLLVGSVDDMTGHPGFAPSSVPTYQMQYPSAAPMRASMATTTTATTRPSSLSATLAHAPAPITGAGEVEDDGTGPGPDEMMEVAAIRDRLGGAANCAAFIAKLWFLVTRPKRYGKYLHWNATGNTVILSTDPDVSNEFAADVLPRLWNHANYSSFIRQMNLYGFQRLPSSRILDKTEIAAALEISLKGPDGQTPTELSTAQQLYGSHSSFLHPKFAKGREDLLPMLKPRNAKKPKGGASGNGGLAGRQDQDEE